MENIKEQTPVQQLSFERSHLRTSSTDSKLELLFVQYNKQHQRKELLNSFCSIGFQKHSPNCRLFVLTWTANAEFFENADVTTNYAVAGITADAIKACLQDRKMSKKKFWGRTTFFRHNFFIPRCFGRRSFYPFFRL